MRIVVAYDISDNFTRQRIGDWLLSQGFTRIQRSVYVGRGGIAKAKDIERFVSKHIDKTRDVVHIFIIQDIEWEKKIVVGTENAAASSNHG